MRKAALINQIRDYSLIYLFNSLCQEYVSCPSCGRTLFDLQEISAEIREKTSHLPGVSVTT